MPLTENKKKYTRDYYENILFSKYKFTPERQRVFNFYLRLIKKRKKNIERVLDIGCAYGYLLKVLEKENVPELYGIDISGEALSQARQFCGKASYTNIDLSQKKSDFPDSFFDVITAVDLIEHIEDTQKFLAEVNRILKPEGLVFFITPNPRSLVRRLYFRIKGREEDPTHVNMLPVTEWMQRFRSAGFGNIEIKGCLLHGFPPFTDLRDKLGKLMIIRPVLVPFYTGERFYIFLKKQL